MKFSISTSFYRRSHLVEKLYQQILDQTHTDWEWIVTDDFSDYNNAKDLLLEICSKDPRVKYYEQSRKKECFYNPQRGTTGEIVVQFDSDDYSYPRILEVYNHLFLKHPDVAGISCLSVNVNENVIKESINDESINNIPDILIPQTEPEPMPQSKDFAPLNM